MKKLLFLFDTDAYASVFDTVVGYDGGADNVTGYANVTPDNVGALVDGCVFTRGGKDKQNTAIFVGGGDMRKGEASARGGEEALLRAVPRLGHAQFQRLEHDGSRRRGVAGQSRKPLAGKKAVVLAGTGPVGMRAAAFLAKEGADVTITSRTKERGRERRARHRDAFRR